MVVQNVVTHENRPLPPDRDWWRGAVIYQIYPRSFQDFERRRHRRPRRHHPAPALRRQPRGRRDLDLAVLPLADARLRLRRDELPRRRSDVRHPRRLRRADRAGARPRPEGDDRPRALPHLRPAPLVPREPVEPRQPQGRLVRLGRCQARRHAAEQLAVDLRRLGLGVGQRAACSITCTTSSSSSRTSTSTIPRSRTSCSPSRASGSSAASTASASTPSTSTSATRSCATTRPWRRSGATIRRRRRSTPTTGRSISTTRAGRR